MNILLIQLPIPKLNYGLKTGNIPLGAACLKQAASHLNHCHIEILPESIASYIADAALVELILEKKPDMVGFTVFAWNIERTLYISEQLKKRINLKIVVGGPEITRDNLLAKSPFIDFYIYGEGELAFINLLNSTAEVKKNISPCCSGAIFEDSKSPYLTNLLEHGIDNIMLLETQRGCPYKCGFCFYNKSRDTITYKKTEHVLEGVRWAFENEIDELYILDPSLNTRPELKKLLFEIARINENKIISINSEIRAEAIDKEMADLFLKAGFTGFEIGLQSTNKNALKIMRRPTNLNQFLKGATLLKEREILPRIDLIVGLPGDTLEGFSGSIGFIAENELFDDVQVFPLSILPGTEFRLNSHKLGITYQPAPPYTVIETDTYSKEDMLLSFDYAESLFDVTLFPFPHLDIGWKKPTSSFSESGDVSIRHNDTDLVSKIIIDSYRSMEDIRSIAERLTFPFQLFVNPNVLDQVYIHNILDILTKANPFSPFEIIFITPKTFPDTEYLMQGINLKRPAFLDNDLRFLFSENGNRSVLFTVVSNSLQYRFTGEMKRQILHWKKSLPAEKDLEKLSEFDGILIDGNFSKTDVNRWQYEFYPKSDNFIPVSFSEISLQRKWIKLTASDEYFDYDKIECCLD